MPPGICEHGDVIRVTARQLVQGAVLFENVFFWQLETDTDFQDYSLVALINTRIQAIYSSLKPDTSEGLDYYDILNFNVTQDRPMINGSWGTMDEGDETSEMAPNGVAALITADTGFSRSRPKKYFGGFTEANLFGNAWSGDLLTHLGSALTTWLTSVDLGGGNQLNPGTWSTTYLVFRPLLTAIVRSAVAYMRRRKPGIGI